MAGMQYWREFLAGSVRLQWLREIAQFDVQAATGAWEDGRASLGLKKTPPPAAPLAASLQCVVGARNAQTP
jgi:hypothetical protein